MKWFNGRADCKQFINKLISEINFMSKRGYDFDKFLVHTMQVLNNYLYRVKQRHCKLVD